ncbi:AraC family transcriptional regulator [Ulvibacterium sp.]|uniref:helix-turn-helix domain-containing protein n=1 Tax=Ulvibacterium sp. TaxID=2665914 RepID=UPI00260E22BD|nr:response regulator transcription factor [Ulvibacterium sp.]
MKTKKLKVGTFMGHMQKMRTLHGFTLSKTGHDQNMKVPRHEHENPYISLLLFGIYHEESKISEYDMKPGSSLFRPKGFEHKNEIGTENSFCFNIEIEKELPDKGHYSKVSNHIRFERNNLELLKIFYAFQDDFSDELLTLTVEENLYHLFQHQHSENATGRAFWVENIKKEIRRYPEKTYRLDEVAWSLHIHPNYFVRKFKEKTGFTFGEFLLRQRVSRGADLMLHSSKSLTEIASECGFYDQSHFIRHFKRFFGTTPFRYRAIVKG